jgi:hypothetical protein
VTEFNSVAFTWRDMGDAKRGRPKSDLSGYAQARGLTFLEKRPPKGYETILPHREGQIFNVVAGTLPGGTPGVMLHERLKVGAAGGKPPQGGGWWGVRYSSDLGPRRPDLGDILDPFDLTHDLIDALDPTDLLTTDLSDFLGGGGAEPQDTSFLVPCTVAATRVPGLAQTQLPRLRIDRRWRLPPLGYEHRADMKDAGLKGWHLQTSPGELDPSGLLTEPLRTLLEDSGRGYFQLVVADGAVVVRRNGFLDDEGELDSHAQALATVAAAARGLAGV